MLPPTVKTAVEYALPIDQRSLNPLLTVEAGNVTTVLLSLQAWVLHVLPELRVTMFDEAVPKKVPVKTTESVPETPGTLNVFWT